MNGGRGKEKEEEGDEGMKTQRMCEASLSREDPRVEDGAAIPRGSTHIYDLDSRAKQTWVWVLTPPLPSRNLEQVTSFLWASVSSPVKGDKNPHPPRFP